jgi:molybdopterin synthase catalytic subunit
VEEVKKVEEVEEVEEVQEVVRSRRSGGGGRGTHRYTEMMSVPLVGVGPGELDLAALVRAVSDSASGDGAIATFSGLVRDHNQGRKVEFLEYEAYEALAVRTLERILDEARQNWLDTRVGVHHRIGRLEIGEASIIIVAASPHRANAFAACRYVIERVKQIVPIWKHEHFAGGDVWLEGATADPEDEAARQHAFKIACA